MSIPHLIKQIFSHPPASPQLIRYNSDKVWETVGGYDQKVLTQFLEDSKFFEPKFFPEKIWKFENEIGLDVGSIQNYYSIKIWY